LEFDWAIKIDIKFILSQKKLFQVCVEALLKDLYQAQQKSGHLFFLRRGMFILSSKSIYHQFLLLFFYVSIFNFNKTNYQSQSP